MTAPIIAYTAGYSADYDWAFDALDNLEDFGSLSNFEGDPGGRTFGGVSEHYHKAWFDELMAATPEKRRCILRRFYYQEFWKPLELDAIGHKYLAYEMFEFSVNTPRGAELVKAQVLALLKCTSLQEAARRHGFLAVVAFNAYQYEYYVERRKSKPQFFASWVRRCFDMNIKMVKEIVGA
jgi:hypothetical protein